MCDYFCFQFLSEEGYAAYLLYNPKINSITAISVS